jgi:hypothetical protein
MENYNLEELSEREYSYGVIRYKYFKLLNYDNNEDNLKEYIKQLNEDSCFNIDYSLYKNEDNEIIIQETIDTLD